jgi:hypothetical protein
MESSVIRKDSDILEGNNSNKKANRPPHSERKVFDQRGQSTEALGQYIFLVVRDKAPVAFTYGGWFYT